MRALLAAGPAHDPLLDLSPIAHLPGQTPASALASQRSSGGKASGEVPESHNPVNVSLPPTIGVCANAGAGSGAYWGGSVCALRVSGQPAIAITGAGGGSSPTASASLGFVIANATDPQQIAGPFGFAGTSGGEGIIVGDEYSAGNDQNGKYIYTNQLSLGAGADLPPVELHGGASYTWVISLPKMNMWSLTGW